MRKYYQRRLPSDPSKDYYFIHRETGKTQPVIIEYGFIDSPNDDVSQLKNNLLDYGEAVVQAVAEYTNTPYIPPEGKNTYVVKKGDSLWSIANKYGITVDELTNANNLTSNLLNVGQILNIPIKETPPTPSDYLIYTVKKGDSLWSIANQYNVDIDDIINTNNLGTTLLQVNQQLLIPNNNNNVTSKTYTVKAGDSLWSIANKYNITVNELKTLNNLTTNILSIGQQLLIPTTNNNENETPDNPNDITYVVQSGDSLWSIAKKYNINVNDLKTYNNLNSNLLSIGQQLLIPKTQNYTTYIVQSGDSLWKIANKYDVTVDEIISLNNLNNTILSIGQVLLIPA